MTILIIIAMAVLALEIASESTLALEVKQLLRIDKVPATVTAFSKLGFWNKWLTKYLFPINLAFSIFFSTYIKLIQLINCQYCLSWWLSSISMYLYSGEIITKKISIEPGAVFSGTCQMASNTPVNENK